MRHTNTISTCITALGLVSAVLATPSTQIWIPSTDIQGYLNPHLGWDVYLTNTGMGTISNGGITMGVLPFKKIGLEIGIDYRDLSGSHYYPVYFNAKLGVPENALFNNMPEIAAGIFDVGLKDSGTNYNATYGLVAKNFPAIGRLSVGGYSGMGPENLWMTSAAKVEKNGVLASWDRPMTEISSKLWLAIDYQGSNNGYGALSFGGSWNWAPNVSTIVGYDIFNDSDYLKPTFTMQMDINFK